MEGEERGGREEGKEGGEGRVRQGGETKGREEKIGGRADGEDWRKRGGKGERGRVR